MSVTCVLTFGLFTLLAHGPYLQFMYLMINMLDEIDRSVASRVLATTG